VLFEAHTSSPAAQRQKMVKQARQRALEAGPRTTLIDLWRGDQQEVVAAFLHLNDIATVPMLSRRFRDQQPLVLLRLARRHGCARAMIGASLNEIAATGRDWSLFSGDSVGAWRPLPAAGDDGDCFAVSMGQGQAKFRGGVPLPLQQGGYRQALYRDQYKWSVGPRRRTRENV